jgi:hypothetical protein
MPFKVIKAHSNLDLSNPGVARFAQIQEKSAFLYNYLRDIELLRKEVNKNIFKINNILKDPNFKCINGRISFVEAEKILQSFVRNNKDFSILHSDLVSEVAKRYTSASQKCKQNDKLNKRSSTFPKFKKPEDYKSIEFKCYGRGVNASIADNTISFNKKNFEIKFDFILDSKSKEELLSSKIKTVYIKNIIIFSK